METRKNDWIATLINTKDIPDISFGVLYANGITPDNIALQDKDYYKDIPQVKREFTENGKFDEAKFDNFYNNALAAYNQYANEDYKKTLLDSVPISPYSIEVIKRPDAAIQNISPIIMDLHDRNRRTFGAENIWQAGKPQFSDAEVAQSKHMRDENGKELDWSPNDKAGLFRSLTIPAAALAIYEDTGYYTNPYTGEEEYHLKGELKLDKDGDPYYQMLGDKDSYGRQMLHWGDVISVEGSIWNKLDIFDADGLETDPAKVIFRSALKVAPFLIPGVQEWAGIATALGGIAFALPTIGKAIDSFITTSDNNQLGRSLTQLENWMARFDKSMPQNIQGKFFTFENIADIMASSVNQFASQRAIGVKAVQWLGMKPKNATQVALGYMALTSSTEAYSEAKQAGANDWTAGLVALGATAAMWGLMNAGYFKDKITEGTILDEDPHVYKNLKEISIKEGQKVFGSNFGKIEFKPGGWWASALNKEKGSIAKFLASTRQKGLEFGNSLKSGVVSEAVSGYFGRAANEGIEEVMEEASADFVKALTLGMQAIGLKVSEDSDSPLDYGFSPEDIMSRYGASFLGGALGGVVFEGVSRLGYLQDPHLRKLAKSDAWTRIYADLQNDPDGSVYEKYMKLADKLNVGNKNLSAIKSIKVEGEEENAPKTLYAVANSSDNQRDYVRSVMKDVIKTAHDLIEAEGLNIFTKQNVLKLILSSDSVKEKLNSEGKELMDLLEDETDAGAIDRLDALVLALKDYGILDRAAIDISNLGTKILKTDIEIEGIKREELAKEPSLSLDVLKSRLEKNAKYKKAQNTRKKLLSDYKDALVGEKSSDYFGFGLSMIEGSPMKYLVDIFNTSDDYREFTNIENYARVMKNVEYATLNNEEKEALAEEFKEFVKQDAEIYWRAWQFYKKASLQMGEDTAKIIEDLKDSKKDTFTRGIKAKALVNLISQQEILNRELDKLKKEDPSNTEEINKLEEALSNAQEAFKQFSIQTSAEGQAALLNLDFDADTMQTETGGPSMLNGALLDSKESRKSAFTSLKRVYKYLVDNNIVPVDKLALIHGVMNSIGSSINTTKALMFVQDDEIVSKDSLIQRITGIQPNISQNVAETFLKEKIGLSDAQIADLINSLGEEDWDPIELLNIAYEDYNDKFEGIAASPEEIGIAIYNEYAPEWLKGNLVEKIESIQKLLSTDFLKGVEALNAFTEEIKREESKLEGWLDLFDFDDISFPAPSKRTADGIVTWLVFNNMDEIYSFTQEIVPILNKVKDSPLEAFLQKLSITFNGAPNEIIPFLRSQWDLLRNSTEEGSFELTKEATQALENCLALVNFATALVEGASGGFNELFNTRSTTKLPTMEANVADILGQELGILKQRIAYILSIGNKNLNKRFEDEKEFFAVDTRRRIKYFVDDPPESKDKKIVEELTQLFRQYKPDFDFKTLAGPDVWDFEQSEEKEESFDKRRMEFQHALHTVYKEIPIDKQEDFLDKIMDIFVNAEPFKGNDNMEVLSKDKTPTTLGMLRWLITNLTVDYYSVAENLKLIFEEKDLLMPTYGQELVIMDAFAFSDNPALGDMLAEKLLGAIKKQKSGDKYIEAMEMLKHLHFINGVPGAGKTEIISFALKRLLEKKYGEKGVDFLVASATKKQAEKLRIALNKSGKEITEAKTLYWGLDENRRGTLGEYILNEGFSADGVDRNTLHQKITNTGKVGTKKDISSLLSKEASRKFLFFDELPLLDEASLKELCSEAAKQGIMIIGLGDLNQITPMIQGEEVGIFNTIFNSSYRLEASFRETNKGQANNNRTLYNIINAVQEKVYMDRSYPLYSADNQVNTAVENMTFIYHDSGDAYYGFNYFSDSNIEDTIIKLMKYADASEGIPICIIIEDEEAKAKYQKFTEERYKKAVDVKTKKDVIELRTKQDAQGSEYEYILADIKFSESSYLAAKELYTVMSRAKNAAFFKSGSLNSIGTITPSDNADAASILRKDNDEKQQEAYNKYKEWRLNLWKDIKASAKPTPTTSSTSGGPSSGMPSGVSGGIVVAPTEENETEEEIAVSIEKGLNSVNGRDFTAAITRLGVINDGKPSDERKDVKTISKVEDLHIEPSKKYVDLDYFLKELHTILESPRIKKYIIDHNDSQESILKGAFGEVANLIWNNAGNDWGSRWSNKIYDILMKTLSALGETGVTVDLFKEPLFFINSISDTSENQVVSLVYKINKGRTSKTALIPIGLVKGYDNGIYRGLPKAKQAAEEIFITADGEYWRPLSEVASGKMRIYNQGAIFCAEEDPNNISSTAEDTRRFNRDSSGKTFAGVSPYSEEGKLSDLLETEWDASSKKITYFLKRGEDGKSRIRLASIPLGVSIEDYIKICNITSQLLYNEYDENSRRPLIKDLASLLDASGIDLNPLFQNISTKQQDEINKGNTEDATERPIYKMTSGRVQKELLHEVFKLCKDSILSTGLMHAVSIESSKKASKWVDGERYKQIVLTDKEGNEYRFRIKKDGSEYYIFLEDTENRGEWHQWKAETGPSTFVIKTSTTFGEFLFDILSKVFPADWGSKKVDDIFQDYTIETFTAGKREKFDEDGNSIVVDVEYLDSPESYIASITDSKNNSKIDTFKNALIKNPCFRTGLVYLNRVAQKSTNSKHWKYEGVPIKKGAKADITYIVAPLIATTEESDSFFDVKSDGQDDISRELLESGSTYGTYKSETDKEGTTTYKFNGLNLSGKELNGIKEFAAWYEENTGNKLIDNKYYTITSLRMANNGLVESIVINGQSIEGVNFEDTNNIIGSFFKTVIDKSSNQDSDIYTGGHKYVKINTKIAAYKGDDGMVYTLYKVGDDYYLVGDNGSIEQVNIITNQNFKSVDTLYKFEGQWHAATLESNGQLRDETGAFVNLDNISTSKNNFKGQDIIAEQKRAWDKVEDKINHLGRIFADFPKKENYKTVSKWINAINSWLKNPKNILEAIKTTKGEIPKSIQLDIDVKSDSINVEVISEPIERVAYEALDFYTLNNPKSKPVSEISYDKEHDLVSIYTEGSSTPIRIKRSTDGFFFFETMLEDARQFLQKYCVEYNDTIFDAFSEYIKNTTDNRGLFDTIISALTNKWEVYKEFNQIISNFEQYKQCI